MKKYLVTEEKEEREEWESLSFYYEKRENLDKEIQGNWGSSTFMQRLFTFIDEANYSESEALRSRLSLVCSLVVRRFVPGSQDKS